ncbi:MAG: methyl-accepting chemotaxis protein [Bacillota bacterium]|nr:methyl-accepting chemotaxis protein [Bacillota bacterium]
MKRSEAKEVKKPKLSLKTLMVSYFTLIMMVICILLSIVIYNLSLSALGSSADASVKQALSGNMTTGLIIVNIVMFFVSILVAFVFSTFYTSPIKKITEFTKSASNGNLKVQLDFYNKSKEVGELVSAIIALKDHVNELVVSISSATGQVSKESKQVATTSEELSRGASDQSSAVEELTSSVEEIYSQTTQSAENASSANALIEQSRESAETSRLRMNDSVETMEEIKVSSDNIAKIIKLIDEIAMQTNLLSINASVEAARAGEYGRGFSVVAEEIRELSTKVSSAAKETSILVKNSLDKVRKGSKAVNESSDALNDIIDKVEQTTLLLNNIAESSKEQELGIAQIRQGLIQVSNIVQTNVSAAEKNSTSSQRMSSQIESLKLQINQYSA